MARNVHWSKLLLVQTPIPSWNNEQQQQQERPIQIQPNKNTSVGVTFAISLLFSLFSMTEYCEHGAILPSSVCTLYCYWILYSALSSDPTSCNTFLGQPTPFSLFVSFLFSNNVLFSSIDRYCSLLFIFSISLDKIKHLCVFSGDRQEARGTDRVGVSAGLGVRGL